MDTVSDTFEEHNEPIEQRIAFGLARLSTALRHHSWQEAAPQGLTPTQGEVLAFLRTHPGSALGEVSEMLGVRPATASDAVRTLVEKGLVTKSRRPDDRRVLELHLTAEGRRIAEATARWPDLLAATVGELGEEERRVLLRAILIMIRNLQQRGQIPVARMCVTCRYFRPHQHPDDPARPHHCAFVDAPFGDRDLRLDCPDHLPAETAAAENRWRAPAASA